MLSDSYLWSPYSRQPQQIQRGPVMDYGCTTATTQPIQVQEVALPVRRTDVVQPVYFKSMHLRIFGALLALMAATTFALGIADVVLTYFNYSCSTSTSACPQNIFSWTWVASGIWASIPIFLTGLMAMCVSGNPGKWVRLFALFCFVSAAIFAPALVVLSALEVSNGVSNFYTSSLVAVGTVAPSSSTTNAFLLKSGIPIAIAVIGFIMFLMTAIMTIALCCCVQHLGIYAPSDYSVAYAAPQLQPVVASYQEYAPPRQPQRDFYYPPRPQIRIPYTPAATPVYQPSLPYMPTRYNNVQNPYGSGVLYGNFPARPSAAQPSNAFFNDFFKPNNAYSWQ